MIDEKKVSEIIMYRGLGYSQKEIAKRLGLSQTAVWYHLNEVNKKAREKGDSAVFLGSLMDGFLPDIIEKINLLKKVI